MVPASVPPTVPPPLFPLSRTPVALVTLRPTPLASRAWTTTEKPAPAIAWPPPFTEVIASAGAGGPATAERNAIQKYVVAGPLPVYEPTLIAPATTFHAA